MFRAAALAALLLFASPVAAQDYFGQNKVRYETFDFKVLKTQHFDVHYYDREAAITPQFGAMAERWYTRLSKVLEYDLSSRQPIIVYADHPDFRSTTVILGEIGESTGGVTEALQRRLVMPMAGPLAETDHVLGHEMVHVFQFDIASRGGSGFQAGLQLPLWFAEGMAEYLSLGAEDPHTAMWMRDAVMRNKLPKVKDLDNPKYFPYRWGQAFWAYVAGRYGDQVVGQMLKEAVRSGPEGAIRKVLGMTSDLVSQQWHDTLQQQYEKVLHVAADPEQKASLLLNRKRTGSEINLSPVLSPDGKNVLFFSERDLFSIDLFLADAQTGEIKRKVTDTALDPHTDSLQFVNSAGAFSADGKRIAFGEINEGRPLLAIYDVARNDVVQRIPLHDLGEIYNPSWSPDGTRIVFSAVVGGITDLFIIDLDTKQLRRLTNDSFAELHPTWSPDGTHIAFVTDRFGSDLRNLAFGNYRLALIDPNGSNIRQLPAFSAGKHTNPQWAPDSRSLYFLSDRDGVQNIYRLSLGDQQLYQVTNIKTGVSGITHLSPAFSVAQGEGTIAYSAFSEGKYTVYYVAGQQPLAGTALNDVFDRKVAGMLPPTQQQGRQVAQLLSEPQVGLPPPQQRRSSESRRYDPDLSLAYVAPPTLAAGVSNYGTLVAGGTTLYFTDMLGYHDLALTMQTSIQGGSKFWNDLAGILSYQNNKSRWTWGFTGGQVPFRSGGFGSGTALLNGEPVVVEQDIAFWQINREFNGIAAYPFNRARRIEFSAGFRNISFDAEERTRAFSLNNGELLVDDKQDIETPDALNLATTSAALVFDNSLFGGTSPVAGRRSRFEMGAAGGSLGFATALADYRHYLRIARPLTLAGRLMHFGRYGGGSEDFRLQDLFLGYPTLVRGYEPNSFSAEECGPPTMSTGTATPTTVRQSTCQVFDQLVGSRIAVANAELRLALLGPFGLVPSRGVPPVETSLFFDTGIAWTRAEEAGFLGGPRDPVSSWGVALRVNLLGFAIGQISYARPLDRPLKDSVWQFTFAPGF